MDATKERHMTTAASTETAPAETAPAETAPAETAPAKAGPGGERADLCAFLAAQRQAVLDVIDGLDEAALRRTVLPSGWTPLGLIEHLAGAERFWFQYILTGELSELPWPESGGSDEHDDEDEDAPFTTEHPVDEVLAFYRDTCARSDAALAAARLDGAPRREIPSWMPPDTHNVRTICLHMIEETARHAGHLDAARELIDGRTGLGPR
jgi:hypothetical protein